jgi:tRNA/tmRNA/rRNA uracil-C5-methylase (TrmA/RlmC/RlmD family)
MRVLDLYAGMGGWSAPARDQDHDVTRVELDTRFDAEVHAKAAGVCKSAVSVTCGA